MEIQLLFFGSLFVLFLIVLITSIVMWLMDNRKQFLSNGALSGAEVEEYGRILTCEKRLRVVRAIAAIAATALIVAPFVAYQTGLWKP